MGKKLKKDKDIDFEIAFYEGIVKKSPDFVEALMVLGDLYTKKGLVEKGLGIDRRLQKIRPLDPIVLYNLACSYSLAEELDRSLDFIKQAIKNGYNDLDFLENDHDLDNLKNDNRFKKFYSGVKKKKDERHAKG